MIEVSSSCTIPEAELKFKFVRSSGPGGQNVNKVATKCELRWNINHAQNTSDTIKARFRHHFKNRIDQNGDVIITSDRFRDQKRNQNDCINKLKVMLKKAASPPKKRRATKPHAASVKKRLEEKRRHSEKKRQRQRIKKDDY